MGLLVVVLSSIVLAEECQPPEQITKCNNGCVIEPDYETTWMETYDDDCLAACKARYDAQKAEYDKCYAELFRDPDPEPEPIPEPEPMPEPEPLPVIIPEPKPIPEPEPEPEPTPEPAEQPSEPIARASYVKGDVWEKIIIRKAKIAKH